MSNETNVVDRKASVGFDKFLSVYVAGCKANKTHEEIANDLGMNLSSYRTRLVGVRKKAVTNGFKFPKAKHATGERTSTATERVSVMEGLLEKIDPTPEAPPTGETAEGTQSEGSTESTEGQASA